MISVVFDPARHFRPHAKAKPAIRPPEHGYANFRQWVMERRRAPGASLSERNLWMRTMKIVARLGAESFSDVAKKLESREFRDRVERYAGAKTWAHLRAAAASVGVTIETPR